MGVNFVGGSALFEANCLIFGDCFGRSITFVQLLVTLDAKEDQWFPVRISELMKVVWALIDGVSRLCLDLSVFADHDSPSFKHEDFMLVAVPI